MPDEAPATTRGGSNASRGKALIVDDEPTNCRLLRQMLHREGFIAFEAHNGKHAIELFDAERPDIIFMDVMMPGMNGFETTRIIKARSGNHFIPVIFLTALRDEKSLIECTAAGGDDFLSKPFSFGILKARIQAMERVRDLQRAIAGKNETLSRLIEKDQEEQKLAERLLSRAVNTRNAATEHYTYVQRPATTFSGDLILSQLLPDGGLRMLIGDFTGHGLAAAIGALPVSDIFHSMTQKGVGDDRVLSEINRKLHQILPADRFMAAWLISISPSGDILRWWNGGMPSGWLNTKHGRLELASHALPLGIVHPLPDLENANYLRVEPEDRLLLMSDGLLETSTDPDGVLFENNGFLEVLGAWRHDSPVMESLLESLDQRRSGEPLDDITIVEIPLGSLCQSTAAIKDPAVEQSPWRWSIELTDRRLDALPSVEEALGPLGLLQGLYDHVGALQTIVTELYTNALEHGVLQLKSEMKATPDGFELYYRERERRLTEATPGWIRISIGYQPKGGGGRVQVRMSDSGAGFDQNQSLPTSAAQPWGRGIKLVRDLCESVEYSRNGTEVEATYTW